jgi:hypothetical protein
MPEIDPRRMLDGGACQLTRPRTLRIEPSEPRRASWLARAWAAIRRRFDR